jgi:hypothetical protein
MDYASARTQTQPSGLFPRPACLAALYVATKPEQARNQRQCILMA